MKHQTPESMKFRKLQRRLGVSRLVVVGTLELLWLATQKNAPQGDIGRFSDEELAIECEWEGDPETLVTALVDCGWLDRCENHRLVVHDWKEHAPGWVKRQLARHKKDFVTVSSLLTVTDDHQEATPNLTQPNPTKPSLREKAPACETITEQEFSETPGDGPESAKAFDGGELIIEWNELAKTHTCLVPFRSSVLGKFEFDAFQNRVIAGDWENTWSTFKKSLDGGRVKAQRLTLKRILEGDTIDVIVHSESVRRADRTVTPKAYPQIPPRTPERPFRDVDRPKLMSDIAWATRKAATSDEPEKFKTRLKQLCEERDWRDQNPGERRRECLEAGGCPPDSQIKPLSDFMS